jgi:hypothetical protein
LAEKFQGGITNVGYVGYGEMFVTKDQIQFPNESSDILLWSKGGILRSESPEQIKFLHYIIEATPPQLKPIQLFTWMSFSCVGVEYKYYLGYLNDAQPRNIVTDLLKDALYQLEIIDTWNMVITPVQMKFT